MLRRYKLSIQNNFFFFWNQYRSEITTQATSNNIYYLIDATFRNINRLFVLSFKDSDDDPAINSF